MTLSSEVVVPPRTVQRTSAPTATQSAQAHREATWAAHEAAAAAADQAAALEKAAVTAEAAAAAVSDTCARSAGFWSRQQRDNEGASVYDAYGGTVQTFLPVASGISSEPSLETAAMLEAARIRPRVDGVRSFDVELQPGVGGPKLHQRGGMKRGAKGGQLLLPDSAHVSATIQQIADWHRMPLQAAKGIAEAGNDALGEPAESAIEEKAHRKAFRKVETAARTDRLSEDQLVWRAAMVVERHQRTLESLSFCVEQVETELAGLEQTQRGLHAKHESFVMVAEASSHSL